MLLGQQDSFERNNVVDSKMTEKLKKNKNPLI